MRFLRPIFLFSIFAIFFFSFVERARAEYTNTFVVTGYYSPLPNQTRYATGTYEGDIRLNGEGVHAADGTQVFPGMIASPRDIPFGTKIFIPGIGVGEVHDRGGAIIANRLDVWMGYGEEGLRRALGWGIREVQATVFGIDPSKPVAIDITKLPMAKDYGLFVRTKYFRHDLTMSDQGGEVEELQRFLKQLGYFQSEITGLYGEETKRAVLQFQVDQNLLGDNDSFGAGHFGPRTRAKFESELLVKANEISFSSHSLKFGDEGDDIKNMQKVLRLLGYSVEENGKFNELTAASVFQFQRSRGIVLRQNEYGASILGPRTRDELRTAFRAYWTPHEEKLQIPERFRSSAPSRLIVFQGAVKLGDKGEAVTRLQEELQRLQFLRVEPTGFFGKVTEHAVFKFQQATRIVQTEKDPGAGMVGPKTREKLHELMAKREEQNRLIVQKTEKQKSVAATEERDRSLIAQAPISPLLQVDIAYGDTHENVRFLQTTLKNLGYFPGHLTSDYFGDLTRNALLKFQMSHGLINSEKDASAGMFDQRTKEKLSRLAQG